MINFSFLSVMLILFGIVTCVLMTPQHLMKMPWDMIPGAAGIGCAVIIFAPCVLQGLMYGRVNAQPCLNWLNERKTLIARWLSVSCQFLALCKYCLSSAPFQG